YQDEWALLTPASDKQQWINFRYLCGFAGCYTPPIVYRNTKRGLDNQQPIYSVQQHEPKRYSNTKTRSISTNTRTSRSYSQTTNSSCYCTSGTYCVGPRGGHYCLNSTGSKRYLPR
ncbi:TPA: hypothetical protein ACSB32_002740, partial [Acinetobacter baumannii]